ncbi:hypothetical protein [Ethanoligenens sp.]|uniref:hypothetical protein n=1 Tax=Ethanoligenens sp. TaxID=2099655 RepID=UPI0039ED0DD5
MEVSLCPACIVAPRPATAGLESTWIAPACHRRAAPPSLAAFAATREYIPEIWGIQLSRYSRRLSKSPSTYREMKRTIVIPNIQVFFHKVSDVLQALADGCVDHLLCDALRTGNGRFAHTGKIVCVDPPGLFLRQRSESGIEALFSDLKLVNLLGRRLRAKNMLFKAVIPVEKVLRMVVVPAMLVSRLFLL